MSCPTPHRRAAKGAAAGVQVVRRQQGTMYGHRLRRIFNAAGRPQPLRRTQGIVRLPVAAGPTVNLPAISGQHGIEQIHAALMRNPGGDGSAV